MLERRQCQEHKANYPDPILAVIVAEVPGHVFFSTTDSGRSYRNDDKNISGLYSNSTGNSSYRQTD